MGNEAQPSHAQPVPALLRSPPTAANRGERGGSWGQVHSAIKRSEKEREEERKRERKEKEVVALRLERVIQQRKRRKTRLRKAETS